MKEVSLFGLPPVCLVWIQHLCYIEIINAYAYLVEYNSLKQDVSRTLILPLTK